MENKEELETLRSEIGIVGTWKLHNGETPVPEWFDRFAMRCADLADKQGYMRALDDVYAKIFNWRSKDFTRENVIKALKELRSQAHDAITRLREGV